MTDQQPPQPPLPPSLDPRGRIAGVRAHRTAARAAGQQPTRRSAGRSRGDVRRGAKLGAQVLAALLSLTVVVGSGWAWATYRSFQGNITQVNALPVGGPSGTDGPPVVDDGKDMNIVLVGKDDRSTATDEQLAELGTERDGGSVLTDTMMLLHVPADGSRATLISFPRDSWVKVPGVGSAKLNAAYAFGSNFGANPDAGRQLLISTLQNMTGLTVDHYVEIDLLGFYTISNALDGVKVNLCRAQQDDFSGIDLPAGESTIQGLQAMAFVRQRHGLDAYGGDLARAARQQYFLTQVFKQVQSTGVLLNPIKLQNLMNAVSGSLKMDDPSFALPLARQMANLSSGNIVTATIPTIPGDWYSDDGQSIVKVDTTAMPDFIAQVIGNSADSAYDSATPAAPADVTVDVLNGAGTAGLAAANAQALTEAGFAVRNVDDAAVTASTTIRYPDGKQAQAKALAAQVPGAVLSRSSTVTAVTLILGQNGLQVASLTPAESGGDEEPTTPSTSSAPAEPTPSTSAEGTRNGADDSCIN